MTKLEILKLLENIFSREGMMKTDGCIWEDENRDLHIDIHKLEKILNSLIEKEENINSQHQ